MKISQGILAALVTSTGAAALPFNRFTSPLEVSLTALGNTQVKVTITNNANRTLNLLRHGTIFDENMPIEKVKVYANGSKWPLCFRLPGMIVYKGGVSGIFL